MVGQTNKPSEQKWFNFHDSSKILTYQQCTNQKSEKNRFVYLFPFPCLFPFPQLHSQRKSESNKLRGSSIPDEICMFTNLIELYQRFTSIFWQNIKLTLLIWQNIIQKPIEWKHSRFCWFSCQITDIVIFWDPKKKEEHNPLTHFPFDRWLSDNQLSGSIPNSVGSLVNLKEL